MFLLYEEKRYIIEKQEILSIDDEHSVIRVNRIPDELLHNLEKTIRMNMVTIYQTSNYALYDSASKLRELSIFGSFWFILNTRNSVLAFAKILHDWVIDCPDTLTGYWILELHALIKNKGYGSKLLRVMIDTMLPNAPIGLCCQTTNQRQINYYSRFGFKIFYSSNSFVEMILKNGTEKY